MFGKEQLKGVEMETSTTSISLIATLKWLFPSLIGSAFAVWYKRKEVDWVGKSSVEKLLITIIGVLLIFVGVVISYYLGSAIIEKQGITSMGFQGLIYIFCGLSSLKILDAFAKNIDPVLETITKGVKDIVKGFVNSFTSRWK